MPKHYFTRLSQLDSLIRVKGTGSPRHLSEKLGVSERTVFDYIDILKSLGAPISFCRERGTYYYTQNGRFMFGFIMEEEKQTQ